MIMQHGVSIAMINHLAVDNLKHEYDTRVMGRNVKRIHYFQSNPLVKVTPLDCSQSFLTLRSNPTGYC